MPSQSKPRHGIQQESCNKRSPTLTTVGLTGLMKLSFSQVLRGGMSPGAPVQYAAGDWKACFTEKGSTLNPTTLAEGSCAHTPETVTPQHVHTR